MQETPGAAAPLPPRLLGRRFGAGELGVVREQLRLAQPVSRAEVARRVCAALQWRSPGGTYALMSARVALLRLHRLGLIALPAPRSHRNNENRRLGPRPAAAPLPPRLACRVDQLAGLRLECVRDRAQARQYRTLLQQHHYLGYSATAGAQVRYLIIAAQGVLGAMGFGAAAGRCGRATRGSAGTGRNAAPACTGGQSHPLSAGALGRCPNLGSKVLALAARRLGRDFRARYGYAPVLLETFVQCDRFTGGVYRAANWRCVGSTQGRGRNSRSHAATQPVKTVWLYPLIHDFRAALLGGPPP